MRHPFLTWPVSGRRGALVALVVMFVATSTALLMVGSPLRHDDAPLGVVSLQFAGTHDEVVEIVGPWIEEGRIHRAGFALGLDHLFMVVYGLLLSALAAALANAAAVRGLRRAGTAAVLAAWAAWLAATCDLVETSASVALLGDPSGGSPGLVVTAAAAKWALLAGVFAVLIGGGMLVNRRGRPRTAEGRARPA